MSDVKKIAVILASGSGIRFGAPVPKQFLKLAGKTVLEHTLDVFERHPAIDEVVIVGSADNLLLINEIINRAGYRKVTKVVSGGTTRQQSSAAGIAAILGDDHKVLVHDAVRPLLDHATIDRCLHALERGDAVDTAIPASDTVIQVTPESRIANIPDRSVLRLGQTPQAFRSGVLRKAHELAKSAPDLMVTDDCGLILHYSLSDVEVVAGDVNNIKITYPSDIYLADRIFQLRARRIGVGEGDLALAGKTIVVFGASRGIGKSVCEIATAAGANVIAVSRASGVDICDEKAVRTTLREAVESYGRIDAVIATAGILRTGLIAGQNYSIIDEQIATNLRGSIVVAREAFEAMREAGGSIALFTSSSYTRGRARYSVYSATKAAIVNLVQALSEEFLPFHVRINAINPERTATPMRIENFGVEPAEALLDANVVAQETLSACFSQSTGEVIDIRL
ncbi:2-C-methyl-D-erythritol 4-phosphate cytidylyltransferase [Stenotrophomonas sp. NLF4-10]|uniref:2-C-methyl-D-erythritol 4-phosphate cytidylyltransferase n=1 Tax=Stenotrophomonas sp. NLF4-10 TaxID=2918754 RepID=UPI001EFA44CD|nr:2-C-methyl-D-erythritol 4-phosphate cytidylyltransferase [Stenotrophomonas sp. NLF4-10]MCG8277394.1 2-C-methyl-D-erythritol 4-phosphate cytidylyltransferase [Stenotrophomonas sp. NLF4-10]